MEAQENNIDLSDFKLIKYKNKIYDRYMINEDGKIYDLILKKWLDTTRNKVKLNDNKYCSLDVSIKKLVWFTFEYDKLDMSKFKPIYYKYEYYPRYLINNDGTTILDVDRCCYVSICLCKMSKNIYRYGCHININGKSTPVWVHQLVKWTYDGGPDLKLKNPEIDHIDKNPKNNHISNLRWVSKSLNIAMSNRGKNNYNTQLNSDIVISICKRLATADETISLCDIVDEFQDFGLNFGILQKIYQQQTWKDISTQFEFPKRKQI